jgi:hypothetical protein
VRFRDALAGKRRYKAAEQATFDSERLGCGLRAGAAVLAFVSAVRCAALVVRQTNRQRVERAVRRTNRERGVGAKGG